VMICVEAFTKWVEAAPLPDKSSASVISAFNYNVLSRYGACAEVVTDQGSEFKGDFEEQLVESGIDHRITSHDHPQADGLAERAVQTIKNCLRRSCEQDLARWATTLPWILMGYRMTPQAATKFSPYVLMFGRWPVVPPAIIERVTAPINYDDPTAAAQSVIERATLLRRLTPQALENILIAQHQDTKRYAQVRSGGYRPELAELSVGDFVYLRPPSQSTLELGATADVLRLVDLRPTGSLRSRAVAAARRKRTSPISRCAGCPAWMARSIRPSPDGIRTMRSRVKCVTSSQPEPRIICSCATAATRAGTWAA